MLDGVPEVSLATVWWSIFFRGPDSRSYRASLVVGLPIVGLGILMGEGVLVVVGGLLGGLCGYWVLGMEQLAHATASALVWREGWLGLSRRSLPITEIDDVVIEPLRGYISRTLSSHIGDLTIVYGVGHVTFEAVPQAEACKRRLYELRDAARQRGSGE